jgi:hypothetical protein
METGIYSEQAAEFARSMVLNPITLVWFMVGRAAGSVRSQRLHLGGK